MANELIQARKTNDTYTLADLDHKAAELGMNRSELINKAVDILMGFDAVFFKKIQGYSEGLHIPEWLVLENMIIKRMADEAAEIEVYGGGTRLLDEFMLVGDGAEHRSVTGEELFNSLKGQYVIKYERKLVRQLLGEEKYGLVDAKGKALLIKYRCGQAWLQSDEYKREQEIHAEIERFKKEYGIEHEIDENIAEWTK